MEQNNQNLPAVQQATAPAPIPAAGIFSDMTAFENAQRVAKMLAASSLVPQQFQGNVPNVMIALEMANRLNASPFLVMQNMYVVHGRPGFSSAYVIACLNACGRFSPLRFDLTGEGDDRGCVAWVNEKATGDRLESSRITIRMAKAEGWYDKPGSKWKTMPEQMLRYRAAAFFGRLYAPDVLLGMQTAEEAEDIAPVASWTPPAQPVSSGPARMEEAVTIDAEVVERPAEPLSGVDAINAMLEAAPAVEAEAEAPENAEPAPAPEPQNAEPDEHRAMLRYIKELDGKAGMSELRGWADRHRQKLAKDLGGESSEFFEAVVEHWKSLVESLPQQ